MTRILNSDEQKMVNGLAENVAKELGNDTVDYAVYQGFIEALKPLKELAKANKVKAEKAEKEAKKADSEKLAKCVHDVIEVGNSVNYMLKSKGIIFKNVLVEKNTDKRLHVTINEDTVAEINGQETTAETIEGLKLGKKYIAFDAVISINGKPVEDLIKKD